MEVLANFDFQLVQGGMGSRGKMAAKSCASLGQLFQSSKGVAEHRMQIQACRRLIQRPESFRIIGIQLKELSDKPLRNLGGQ